MDTIEGNKLIAEFMGYPEKPLPGTFWDYDRSLDMAKKQTKLEVASIDGNQVVFVDEMPYRSYDVKYFQDGKTFVPHGYNYKTHLPSCSYDSSWDWLIPVVERIESLDSSELCFSVKIQDSSCDIDQYFSNGSKKLFLSRDSDKKITATWKAVVAFIQWYKSSTTPNNGE